MVICVANTHPKKVRLFVKGLGEKFAMWKEGMSDPDVHFGFFNFYDMLKVRTKKVPFFFNIVSSFAHIAINHPLYQYDYKELPNGLVFFKEPDPEGVKQALQQKYSRKAIREVLFRPTKLNSYEGSELARRWNNFILTLPSRIAEAFMLCFLQSVRNNDKIGFGQFIIDNRLIGTGNQQAYKELEELIKELWPALRASVKKTEKAQKHLKAFKKEHPDLESSISRFAFWNKSYKGTDLAEYMDDENNVSYGIAN